MVYHHLGTFHIVPPFDTVFSRAGTKVADPVAGAIENKGLQRPGSPGEPGAALFQQIGTN